MAILAELTSPASMDSTPDSLLTDLLRSVSRSFYLTLRVLPSQVRHPIGLAYLLARASDTIADTAAIPVKARLDGLDGFRRVILDPDQPLPSLTPIQQQAPIEGERHLMERLPEVVTLFTQLYPLDRQLVSDVISTILTGQRLDLVHFQEATPLEPVALADEAALDHYTYSVAGCVGEFWTRMCLRHLPGTHALGVEPERLVDLGIRFGKGLQLVNILRDVSKDAAMGRCYLPATALAGCGITPGQLTDPTAQTETFHAYWESLGNRAEAHLAAGWQYVQALPPAWTRLRLACAWPLLIGIKTLGRLRLAPGPTSTPVKVSRAEVYDIMARTFIALPFSSLWRNLFAQLQATTRRHRQH